MEVQKPGSRSLSVDQLARLRAQILQDPLHAASFLDQLLQEESPPEGQAPSKWPSAAAPHEAPSPEASQLPRQGSSPDGLQHKHAMEPTSPGAGAAGRAIISSSAAAANSDTVSEHHQQSDTAGTADSSQGGLCDLRRVHITHLKPAAHVQRRQSHEAEGPGGRASAGGSHHRSQLPSPRDRHAQGAAPTGRAGRGKPAAGKAAAAPQDQTGRKQQQQQLQQQLQQQQQPGVPYWVNPKAVFATAKSVAAMLPYHVYTSQHGEAPFSPKADPPPGKTGAARRREKAAAAARAEAQKGARGSKQPQDAAGGRHVEQGPDDDMLSGITTLLAAAAAAEGAGGMDDAPAPAQQQPADVADVPGEEPVDMAAVTAAAAAAAAAAAVAAPAAPAVAAQETAPRPLQLPKQLQRKHSATPHQEQQQQQEQGQAQEPGQDQQQQAAAQEQSPEQKVQPPALPLEYGFPNLEAFQFPLAQGFLPNAAAVWGATAMLPPAAQGWLASVRAAAEALMNGSEEQLGLLTGPMAPAAAADQGGAPLSPAAAAAAAAAAAGAAAAGPSKQQPAARPARQRKPKFGMSEEDTEETEDMDVDQPHHGTHGQQQQRDQQQGDWSMRRSGRQRKPKVYNPPPSSSSSEDEAQEEEAMTESEPEADTPAQRQARWRAKQQQQRQAQARTSLGAGLPALAPRPLSAAAAAAPRLPVAPTPGAPILAADLLQANPPELVLLQQHQKKREEDSEDLGALLSAGLISPAVFSARSLSGRTAAPSTMPTASSIEHARQAFDWALQLLLECDDPGWLAEEPTSVVVRSHTNKDGVLVTKTDLIKLFHVPLETAAELLGVKLTVFKKHLRTLDIHRWPHRKFASLANAQGHFHERAGLPVAPRDMKGDMLMERKEALARAYLELLMSPNLALTQLDAGKHVHASHKQKYKQKKRAAAEGRLNDPKRLAAGTGMNPQAFSQYLSQVASVTAAQQAARLAAMVPPSLQQFLPQEQQALQALLPALLPLPQQQEPQQQEPQQQEPQQQEPQQQEPRQQEAEQGLKQEQA